MGKSTGKPYFMVKKNKETWFPVDLPINQSIPVDIG
jgi:hypothetical protein